MPRYYPVNLNCEGRLCVVIGGGGVASRRIAGLLEAGAKARVVSPKISPEIRAWADAGRLEWIAEPYAAVFLTGAFLVIIATNNGEVNAAARMEAQARGILVNAADAAELGDFVVPAAVRRGDLLLSVATGGATPSLAAQICRELESRFGPEYAEYMELLGHMRDYIKSSVPEPERRAAHARLLSAEPELLALLREGRNEEAQERAVESVEKTENRK